MRDAAVQEHKQELQNLRQRFVDEMERSVQDKSTAIEDIEQSYSEALRAARIAALKAAAPKYREAYANARARRQQAELAAFYATEDDGDEAQEMADTMEFDDQGEGE